MSLALENNSFATVRDCGIPWNVMILRFAFCRIFFSLFLSFSIFLKYSSSSAEAGVHATEDVDGDLLSSLGKGFTLVLK